VLNERQHELAAVNEYNFDHPDAFDFELLFQTLLRLKEMKKVEVPIYNFVSHRKEELDQIPTPFNLDLPHRRILSN
jgi:uridine kinase